MRDPAADASRAQGRASDPGISAWVSANAGSGKTHVLVNRVIRLMLSGAEPERILCLTFTRAAAAEMSRRLFQVLSGWIALDDDKLTDAIHTLSGYVKFGGDLKAARRLFARALETPGGLKIQTIHAFCERLLQRFPVEAGVAPGFRVLEELEAAALLGEARGEVVAEASRSGAPGAGSLACIVAHAGEDALDGLLRELLEKRSELKHLLAQDDARERALAGLCAFLSVEPEEMPRTIAEVFAIDLDRIGLARAAGLLSRCQTKSNRALAGRLYGALAAGGAGQAFQQLKPAYLKKDGKRKSDSKILTARAARDHPDIATLLWADADRVAELAERERAVGIRDATMALLELADQIIGRYEAKKLRLGRYDYDDLIQRTRSLFMERETAAWVLYRLDGGLDHILLDEAQDTSREQWEIVRELASEFFAGEGQRGAVERTLFAVGDRKQSVFSFQGADPQAFDDMQAHFRELIGAARKRFETVPLAVSFRSTQDILDAVDAVFAGASAAQGVVAKGDGALVHSASRVGQPGLIEIWEPLARVKAEPASRWRPGEEGDAAIKPRVLLANRIAGLIRRWLDEGECLTASGRRVKPGDFLILLRQRTTFMDLLVKALKQRAIPVAGVDRLLLGQHLAVQDLLSLVRFCLMPEDDLALAELLKSPLLRRDDGLWIGDEDLLRIAAERGGLSLWAALRKAVEAGAPYARANERIASWAARAGFEPPYEFLAGVLNRDGGRKALLERLGPEADEPLDALLNLALDFAPSEAASLRGFLAHVEEEGGEIKRDADQTAEEVRVMTVHGAKGLEAPIVFLPDTCDPPSGRDDDWVLMTPGREGVPAIPVWRLKSGLQTVRVEALRSHHQERAKEEYRRLLYVAMTRARDRLYVCGAMGKGALDPDSWHALIADALKPKAKELLDDDGRLAGWRIEGGAERPDFVLRQARDEAMPGLSKHGAPLPAWANAPAPEEPPAERWLMPSRALPAQGELVSPPAGKGAGHRFLRGRLVHRMLQMLPDIPAANRRMAGRRYLERAGRDLSEEERETLLDEAMAIIEAPELGELFAPGSLAEVPVAAILGEGVRLTGQIDRIAIGDREIVLADYKTNRPPPERLEDVDPAYIEQLTAYRRALQAIYPGKPVRSILVWTDGPRAMEVPEGKRL